MAQDWTNVIDTVGTAASRDFTDPTSADAAFPTDFRTGGGVNHVLVMFADSVFTDVDLDLGPGTVTNTTRACNVKLVNAVGESPVWKPGTGSQVGSYLEIHTGMTVAGILFDGDDRDITTGLLILRGTGSAAGLPTALGCTFKDSSATGVRFATTGAVQAQAIYCLAFDNFANGFNTTGPVGQQAGTCINCGSAFNTGRGYGSDNGALWDIRGSWARGNTQDAVQAIRTSGSVPGSTAHNVIDDGSFTTLGLTLGGTDGADILENATQLNFNFANETTRDFTPQSGSVLLGKGADFGSSNAPRDPFDVKGNRLQFDWDDRMDVGPIQSKIAAPAQVVTPLVVTTGLALDVTTGVEVIAP